MPTNYDDKNNSLCHEESIISQIVDIGNQQNQEKHFKLRYYIKNLQCLQPKNTQLHRVAINAFDEREYLALSYTWVRSEYEDGKKGRFLVEGWDEKHLKSSDVRDCVFDRILKYMRYKDVQLLWIDKHSIPQDTCETVCTIHDRCIQKRDALQIMDLVYKLSKHPVGLLGRPMKCMSELNLLECILSGKLVDGSSDFRLSTETTIHKAKEALGLLHDITQDRWWQRAWTFQENYRGGRRMRLLIRHDPSLERRKLSLGGFGKIEGELCVPAVTLSEEATRICLALRKVLSLDDVRISDVLRAAGRYAILLEKSSAMTPTIIEDIEARMLDKPWDRLAIIANCCQYPVRLRGLNLIQQNHSLSLSVLAMCLLNGEILNNGDGCAKPTANLPISSFLKEHLFKAFDPPRHITKRLSHNKGCRLADVELTPNGISTMGHLWKLGRVIDTTKFRRKLPWIDNPKGELSVNQRKRLLQLVFRLCDLQYRHLGGRIDEYLVADAQNEERYPSFTRSYLHCMAGELAAAIRERRKLRLGSINDRLGRSAPYRAVFVCSNDGEEQGTVGSRTPAFVFTSAWSRDPGTETHDANDIDHHVSLEVTLDNTPADDVPHLRIRRWMLGMCFFEGCPRTRVVFPWPRAWQAQK